ncbi:MAG TPA: helix-turn-helix domain-containing protein [Pyrinomonadaceae bacterium]|nr:helix-turn-helix domain-containing protein [Pyrinomonadaceae bacterium]
MSSARELENNYRNGNSHGFRSRCQMVLLKSEKRTSVQITEILGGCEMAVNNWLKRYEKEGLKGLEIRGGRGRPAILQAKDLESVKAQVKLAGQRISLAKSELENSLERSFSLSTLKRYLKKTVAATNELEND